MNNFLIKILIQLKNASFKKKEVVYVVYDKTLISILKILYKEGLIQSFNVFSETKAIKIFLRYSINQTSFLNLKFLSTPSRLVYVTSYQLLKINIKSSFVVVSTSQGILTLVDCKRRHLGGQMLFLC